MWIDPFFDDPSSDIPVLSEVFFDYAEGDGIFDALADVATMPWNGVVQPADLDLEYFGSRSGAKFAAPLVVKMYTDAEGEITDANRVTLARIIWNKFRYPWKHLWDTNLAEYNPIHNYDMIEQRNLVKEESTSSKAKSKGNSVDETDSTSKSKDFVFGLNSAGDGKASNAYENSEASGSSGSRLDDSETSTARENGEVETLNRKGNIGVTTTQNMLEQERAVWAWNFFEQVFKDIDSVLSLPIYDSCRV